MVSLQQFVAATTNKPIDEDGAYGAQCWDLVFKYVKEVIGCPRLPTRPGGKGGAKDVYNFFLPPLPQFFDRVANDPKNSNQVPKVGDIVVWGETFGGGLGHIAIVIDAPAGSPNLVVFGQNAPFGSLPHQITMNYRGMLGWLTPKNPVPAPNTASSVALGSSPSPVGLPPAEGYVIQRGDNFWALEEQWKLPHGTLRLLNPHLDPRNLQIGQTIRIRNSAPAPAPAAVQTNDEFYIMQRGDNMWTLENKLGMSHGTLQRLNPDINPREIPIGYKLRIKESTVIAPVLPAPVAVLEPPKPQVTEQEEKIAEALAVPVSHNNVRMPSLESMQGLPEPPPKPKLTFLQKHFSKDKILHDLGAVASFTGAAISFGVDHSSLIFGILSALGGLLFGSNRFGKK